VVLSAFGENCKTGFLMLLAEVFQADTKSKGVQKMVRNQGRFLVVMAVLIAGTILSGCSDDMAQMQQRVGDLEQRIVVNNGNIVANENQINQNQESSFAVIDTVNSQVVDFEKALTASSRKQNELRNTMEIAMAESDENQDQLSASIDQNSRKLTSSVATIEQRQDSLESSVAQIRESTMQVAASISALEERLVKTQEMLRESNNDVAKSLSSFRQEQSALEERLVKTQEMLRENNNEVAKSMSSFRQEQYELKKLLKTSIEQTNKVIKTNVPSQSVTWPAEDNYIGRLEIRDYMAISTDK